MTAMLPRNAYVVTAWMQSKETKIARRQLNALDAESCHTALMPWYSRLAAVSFMQQPFVPKGHVVSQPFEQESGQRLQTVGSVIP